MSAFVCATRAASAGKALARFLLLFLLACAAPFALGEQAARYDSVTITAPAPDATVHDNQGNVAVQVRVSPALRPGDRVVLLLDGSIAAHGVSGQMQLSGVDRGEHTLQAQVVAADGAPQLESAVVRFYLWHASRLFPHRRD